MLASARFVRNEEDARAGAAQTEDHLALAEDWHEGTADCADAQRRERYDDELQRVQQLERDALTGLYPQAEQQHRGAVDLVQQLLPRQRRVAPFSRLDDRQFEWRPARLPDEKLIQRELRGAIGLEHRRGGFRPKLLTVGWTIGDEHRNPDAAPLPPKRGCRDALRVRVSQGALTFGARCGRQPEDIKIR